MSESIAFSKGQLEGLLERLSEATAKEDVVFFQKKLTTVLAELSEAIDSATKLRTKRVRKARVRVARQAGEGPA